MRTHSSPTTSVFLPDEDTRGNRGDKAGFVWQHPGFLANGQTCKKKTDVIFHTESVKMINAPNQD